MDICSPADYQLLSYALAVQEQGYRLTVKEFEAYAASPSRRPARMTSKFASQILTTMGNLFAGETVVAGETSVEHFRRVGWTATEGERVAVTALGRAVVRAMDVGSSEDEIVQTALEPDDPLAYARVVAQLAQLEDVLVVDPYFRAAQLLDLFGLRSLTRILTSYKVGENDISALGITAGVIQWDRAFEIRAAAKGATMHDRFLVPLSGAVFQVGTSLSGIGRSFTVLSPLQDVAEVVRQDLEELWRDAEVVYSTHQPDPG